MKVYGVPVSPFVRKVLVVLQLKELPCEIDPVLPGEANNKEFADISALRKIPAFKDDTVGLADSSVICEYLDEQYPDIRVYPDGVRQKARARWLEEYADSKLAQVCGTDLFFERVVKPNMMEQACDEDIVANTINTEFPPVLDYLESQVPEHGFFFDNLSTADVAISSQFLNAKYANYTVDSTRWPMFANYLQRVWQHPAFAAQIEQEQAIVDKLLSKAGLAT